MPYSRNFDAKECRWTTGQKSRSSVISVGQWTPRETASNFGNHRREVAETPRTKLQIPNKGQNPKNRNKPHLLLLLRLLLKICLGFGFWDLGFCDAWWAVRA